MTRALIIRPEAENDLAEAHGWYEEQLLGLGSEFLNEVQAALKRIELNPEAYARLRGKLRRVLVRRFPYGVFYLVERERIVVVAVLHASRDPRLWQRRAKAARE